MTPNRTTALLPRAPMLAAVLALLTACASPATDERAADARRADDARRAAAAAPGTAAAGDVANCPDAAAIDAMTRRWLAREPVPVPPADLDMAAARCGRDRFVQALQPGLGPVVGYKAGLTSEAVQKRFGYAAPLRGTLLRGMILPDGAQVPAAFGTRPVFEADLIAVVSDDGINDATTADQALAHISEFRPFLELPDLVVADPGALKGPGLQLINVGARLGVLGPVVPVRATTQADRAQWSQALAAMKIHVTDGEGRPIDEGNGAAILGNPLNAVLWLAQDVRSTGGRLRAGDLLSLGSFSKLLPPSAGQTVRATYEGLPGNPSVSVRFR